MFSRDREILEILHRVEYKLERVLYLLRHHRASTRIASVTGEIDMAQTLLTSAPGADTLSFQTFDNSSPSVDITARCTYSVVSDGSAVVVGAVSGNTASVSYSVGTANITITTVDSGGDSIPAVVLAATIMLPPVGTTTVTASNPTTKIS